LSDEEYNFKLKSIENKIDETLSKKMSMEPNPFVVLTLLEKISNPDSNEIQQGSYGYLFRVIIDIALLNEFHNQDDISVIYSFLAQIAYQMFQTSDHVIGKEKIPEIIEQFKSKYLAEFSENDLRKLVDSGMLIDEDDVYYFRHGYMYPYFVAHYLNLNVMGEKPEVQAVLKRLCENLLVNDNAVIIMFYAFQSNQDPYLIDLILEQSKLIFASEKEFDLALDSDKLNKSIASAVVYYIPDNSAKEKREKYLRQKDEEEKPVKTQTKIQFILPEKSPLDRKSFDLSLRMLYVLGQIIKNYPGSINSSTKLKLTNECYSTGLRTLSALAKYFQDNADVIKTNFITYLENIFPSEIKERLTSDQRKVIISGMVSHLLFMTATSYFLLVIKNISKPIGSQRLSLLFSKVKENRTNATIDFIDVSIELDHYKEYPTHKIQQLCEHTCTKNPFAKNLLAQLVLDNYMNYPPTPRKYKTTQKIYGLLGIKREFPKIGPALSPRTG
jgi:hypothetical protein